MKLNKLAKNFVATAAVASLARHAKAQSLTFQNLDNRDRVVVFTANPGCVVPAPITVPGGQALTQPMSAGWAGNVRAAPVNSPEGPDVTGNLGEFAFDLDGNLVDFDVSSINNVRTDKSDGINFIVSASGDRVSGCPTYDVPCANDYNQPNDVETKATLDQSLTVYMGVANGEPLTDKR